MKMNYNELVQVVEEMLFMDDSSWYHFDHAQKWLFIKLYSYSDNRRAYDVFCKMLQLLDDLNSFSVCHNGSISRFKDYTIVIDWIDKPFNKLYR